jgi:hypothetical protein
MGCSQLRYVPDWWCLRSFLRRPRHRHLGKENRYADRRLDHHCWIRHQWNRSPQCQSRSAQGWSLHPRFRRVHRVCGRSYLCCRDRTPCVSWHHHCLLQHLLVHRFNFGFWCYPIVLLAWFIPESPRWLYVNHKREKAVAVLTKYHGYGNEDSAWVKLQLEEYEAYLNM